MWSPLLKNTIENYDLGCRKVHNNWRQQVVPWICRVHVGWALTESYWACQADKRLTQTLLGDGTEKRKMHVESCVVQLPDGRRITFMPWFQSDKAGQTTTDHTFTQSQLCQDAYGHLFDVTNKKLSVDVYARMPRPAPHGHLLCNLKNSNNDHAGVELKRVDCVEAAIRLLTGNPAFTFNRATCDHRSRSIPEHLRTSTRALACAIASRRRDVGSHVHNLLPLRAPGGCHLRSTCVCGPRVHLPSGHFFSLCTLSQEM